MLERPERTFAEAGQPQDPPQVTFGVIIDLFIWHLTDKHGSKRCQSLQASVEPSICPQNILRKGTVGTLCRWASRSSQGRMGIQPSAEVSSRIDCLWLQFHLCKRLGVLSQSATWGRASVSPACALLSSLRGMTAILTSRPWQSLFSYIS